MSILLRDVIDIPERIGADDYVLRLTDSTDDDAHIRATVEAYVLTESLKDNFASAISLISDAIRRKTSRGAYLAGSFGSGKSHFMAVLYALLGNHPALRTERFRDLTARYDADIAGKNILSLTYHFLGTKSMEEAIFRGYIDQIRRLHPEAPLPALHVSDTLLADAEHLREKMGDGPFLAGLGSDSAGGDDAWGGLVSDSWTLERYHAGLAASAESEARKELVSALVRNYFSSFLEQAEYVDLDRGLSVISEHAEGLGYDAVVLFLDELILWLIFYVRNNEIFSRESQKITKLVEGSGNPRPIPLVSFISRQMDLRKWLADAGASGAEQDASDRVLQYQQGRFSTIELGNDNLAEVANIRLLQPKNDEAEQALDEAFRTVTRSPEVWDVLRDSMNTTEEHRGSSEQEFRLTYPFSPALVSTLRELASVMQRDRTALKVMQRMLVERRDTLTTADLIPVGDAFGPIVDGEEPIDGVASTLFKAAESLYRDKMLPLLLTRHQVTQEQLDTDPDSVPAGFRAHDRIAKTLLLSAIAPKVPALRDITASRLAALNHGSIKTRMKGGEARVVLGVVREWAKDIPEITVSEGANPIIRVQLSNVDYNSVLERIRGEDNSGKRKVLIRTLVHKALGVDTRQDDLAGGATRTVIWRGSRREVDVVFGNVRDASSVPEQNFDNRPGTWRLVVDYPFDEGEFSAADDIARIDRLLSGGDRHTIVWLPKFFSDEARQDLALLVKLDWLFGGTGDRWQENTDHLSPADRAQARGILENLYRGTLNAFERLLEQAYGIEAADPKYFVDDPGHTEILTSLSKDFSPKLPTAVNLRDAFDKVIDQAFTALYPNHPQYPSPDDEVTTRHYEIVRGFVEEAVADRQGRVPTAGAERKVAQRIAAPLKVGKATEDHFLFGEDTFAYWAGELDRAAAETDRVTVGVLQHRIDSISPAWGLRPEARDLIVAAWALLRKRAWFEAGAPVPAPPLGRMRESIELRAEELPEQAAWDAARTTVSYLLGYTMPRTFLTGANVADFAQQVRARAGEKTADLRQLADRLADAHRVLKLDVTDTDRISVARALVDYLDTLAGTSGNVALIDLLATAPVPGSAESAGRMRTEAAHDAAALRGFQWKLVGALLAGAETDGERGESARVIVKKLKELITTPGTSLADQLNRTETRVVEWVVGDRVEPGPVPVTPLPPKRPSPTHRATPSRTNPDEVMLEGIDDLNSLTAELREAFEEHGARLRVQWWVE